MKLRRRRRAALVLLFVLAALFLARPKVPRLSARISQLLSWELGRQVEIGAVEIRFLPQPELELKNLVVEERAGFSTEPLLRSPDVMAQLRTSALLHGRLEIASLSLNQASLNLTRSPSGQWNFEDLIERTARSSLAPTSAGRKEARTKFPYIEATEARINLKNGQEKTHFAFTEAEFALWQEAENQWGMRVRARPIRTDANLTDTGWVSLTGIWQRAALVENIPLEFSLQWSQAQIGQVSTLAYGNDQGWRGNLTLAIELQGTPRALRVSSDVTVDDFRRQDVLAGGNLRLAAHCALDYDAIETFLSNLDCAAASGDGWLEAKGSAAGIPLSSYNLAVSLKDVPADSVLRVVRHINRRIPEEFAIHGLVNASVELSRNRLGQTMAIRGQGEADELLLTGAGTDTVVDFGRVPFKLAPVEDTPEDEKNALQLELGPVNVAFSKSTSVQARAVVSRSFYRATLRGEGPAKRLLGAAHLVHIPAPDFSVEGTSAINLTLEGTWDTSPLMVGTADLASLRARVRGLNDPLEILSAHLILDPRVVRVPNFEAAAAETIWRGSLSIPRPCASPDVCDIEFRLHSAEVSASALNQLLNPRAAKSSWYRFFAPVARSYLLSARARGKVSIERLVLGRALCHQFSTDLRLEQANLALENMRGQLFGGRLAGDWKVDFSKKPPLYSGNGSFDGISVASVSGLIEDEWLEGSGSARYQFQASGSTLSSLLASGHLNGTFLVKNGVFPHLVLSPGSPALHAASFSGKIALENGRISFAGAKLETTNGLYTLGGTASLDGALNLKMTSEGASGYAISGTVEKTAVSPVSNPPTRASLKP